MRVYFESMLMALWCILLINGLIWLKINKTVKRKISKVAKTSKMMTENDERTKISKTYGL
jgi:hypothetical protein